MKVLVFKAFNQLHPVHNLRSACKGHDLVLACYSPCMENRYREYIDTIPTETPFCDYPFYPFKKEFIDFSQSDRFLCERKQNYDFVIRLSEHEMSFGKDCINRILEPFENQDVSCVYSDFNVVKGVDIITAIHLSQPSPVSTYPIFAFRSSVLDGESDNIVQQIVTSSHSHHVIDPLVTIYE